MNIRRGAIAYIVLLGLALGSLPSANASIVWNGPGLPDALLTMTLSGPSSTVGFAVTISGGVKLLNGIALSNATVYTFYKFRDALPYNSWVAIATTRTTSDGNFSFQWIPTVTGDYVVQGSLCFFPDYPGIGCGAFSTGRTLVPVFVSLSVLPIGNQQLISVSSNSTITALSFNSTSQILAFQLNGTASTTAWVEVSVAKTLLANTNLLQVKANSVNVPFQTISSSLQWIITFYVTFHSLVSVNMNIQSTNPIPLGSILTYAIYGSVFVVGLVLGLRGRWLYLKIRPKKTLGVKGHYKP